MWANLRESLLIQEMQVSLLWFGDNIDTKVVESAINFWFKDDDYKSGDNKVYKYFRGA